MTVQPMTYYRVSCDFDECTDRINVAALDREHLTEVLDSLKNRDGSKWVASSGFMWRAWCPKHSAKGWSVKQ